MKLDVEISKKLLSREEFMNFFKKTEVLEFCKACDNYGKNHSCPEFEFSVEEYLAPYDFMLVVITIVHKKSVEGIIEYILENRLDSKVVKRYQGEDTNPNSEVSMYIFEKVKDFISDKLLSIENELVDSLSLYPGSCTICDYCEKEYNRPCNNMSKMRYSLEALGFMVSEIYENLGVELLWSIDGIPEKLTSCSGLMLKNELDASLLLENHITIDI